MTQVFLESIVEGDGEQRAMPVLIKRIISAYAPGTPLAVGQGWRLNRDKIVRPGNEMSQAINVLAKSTKRSGGGILVLCDADDDCPATLGPELQRRIQALRSDLKIAVVLANREFEAWFLACASKFAAATLLNAGTCDHPSPESPRGTKELLTANMPPGSPYKETLHQELFCKHMDIALTRTRSASFDKLCRELLRLAEPAPNA